MALNLAGVKTILEAANAKATEMGVRVSIAVVDARGDLLGLYRMDGARWGTANFSQGKAFASATYGQPSGALSERANLPIMQSALLQSGGRDSSTASRNLDNHPATSRTQSRHGN